MNRVDYDSPESRIDWCRQPSAPLSRSRVLSRDQKKKNFTWSIKRNYDDIGNYDANGGSISDGYSLFPSFGTYIGHLLPGKTKNISPYYQLVHEEDEVENLVRMALASWQSVVDIQLTQVELGGDVVIEFVPSLAFYNNWKDSNGDWHPEYIGAEGWGPPTYAGNEIVGGRIVFGLYRRVLDYSTEYYIDWSDPNNLYYVTLHEFGHVLGLSHQFAAKGHYSPKPRVNTAVMDYEPKMPDGSVKQYLTNHDINLAKQRWGLSKYKPLIELWIPRQLPSRSQHYYTDSWDEANKMVKTEMASDMHWFHGVLARNGATTDAGSEPQRLYRNFAGQSQTLYSLDAPLNTSGTIDGGYLGYVWRYNYQKLTPLHQIYHAGIDNFKFSTDPSLTFPNGYTFDAPYGYIIDFNAMVGYSAEKSYF